MKAPRKVLQEVSTQEVPPEGFAPWASPSLPGGAAAVGVGGVLAAPYPGGITVGRAAQWGAPTPLFLPGDPTYLRFLPGPPPAPLLRHVLLALGGQALAGFGSGFAHRPSSCGEEEREGEEDRSVMAGHAGQCRSLQTSARGRRALATLEGTHVPVRDEWRLTAACPGGRWPRPCHLLPPGKDAPTPQLPLSPLWEWRWPMGYQPHQEVTRTGDPPSRKAP